jgi:acyl-CoA synthetase (NDP forming)
VPELPQEEQDALLAEMPQPFYGNLSNPVDTTAQVMSKPEAMGNLLFRLERSPSIDMMTTVAWEQAATHLEVIVALDQRSPKPLSLLCTGIVPFVSEAGTPLYLDPGRAVRTLGALARQSLDRPAPCRGEPIDMTRAARARAMLPDVAERTVLMEHEGKRLFAEYGIGVTQERLAATPAQAAAAAREIGGSLALKAMSVNLPHKSDAGGVRLGVTADRAEEEAAAMLADVARLAPQAQVEGILVQEMVPARIELTAGIKRDEVFGPVVVLGLGGLLVEILADAVMLRPPFDRAAARKALESLSDGRIIHARRGLDAQEVDAVVGLLMSLGQMARELPEIAEVDANPVRIAHGRAVVADALVILASAEDARSSAMDITPSERRA